MKKLLICVVQILCLLLISGCWDTVEYENMAMISAIGIDYDNEKEEFTVSIQKLASIKGGSSDSGQSAHSSNSAGVVHAIKGKTIYDAISESQTVITKRLFFGCTKALLIGEDAAKYKLMDIVDLMDRTPSLREKIDIVIVKNAEETLSTVDYSKTTPSGIEISNLISQSSNSGAFCSVSAQDFQEMLAISGLEAVAPHIVTSSNQKIEAKGGVEGNISSYEERIGNEVLAGIAVFKGDHFVGYLNENESDGFCWIKGEKINLFKAASISDNSQDFAYYYIKNSKSSMSVKIENNQPVVYIKVNINAELRKNPNGSGPDMLLPEALNELEIRLSESVRADIEGALAKCQKEYKSDVFGFGFKLFRENPKLWQEKYESEWDSIFPNLPVNVEVNTRITGTGTNIRKFVVK